MDQPQKYIHQMQDGNTIRCRVKHIVCIISVAGKRHIYECEKNRNHSLLILESGYNLAKFKAEIKDPYFYPIFDGVLFNSRFYKSINANRSLQTTLDNAPQLIVSRKVLSDFKKHVLLW